MSRLQKKLFLEIILVIVTVFTVFGFLTGAIIYDRIPRDLLLSIWLVSALCALALIISSLYFIHQMTARLVAPISDAIDVAEELMNGNYRARTYDKNFDDDSQLGRSINQLAKRLLELKVSNDIQRDRMETLIENVSNGLLLVDEKGFVSLVNASYRKTFSLDAESLHLPFYKAIKQHEVTQLIENVYRGERRIVSEMERDARTYHIVGDPIFNDEGEWKGVLVAVQDISELKNFEKMRKEFVANVSHELKTPATSLKGFAETLLDGAKNDPVTLTNFLNIILTESDRLQILIDDLLELSKIENSGVELHIDEVEMVSLIEQCCSIIKLKADEKQIDLHFEHESDTVHLSADSIRLNQVVINLISNAISYTPEKGCVTIRLFNRESQMQLEVSDTGIGIDQAHFPRIFERFYRVDKARSRSEGGTGLGLAIVKHIVEAHHGTVHVKSKLGQGSTFSVHLPKVQCRDCYSKDKVIGKR